MPNCSLSPYTNRARLSRVWIISLTVASTTLRSPPKPHNAAQTRGDNRHRQGQPLLEPPRITSAGSSSRPSEPSVEIGRARKERTTTMAAGEVTLSTVPGCGPDDRESPASQFLFPTKAFEPISVDFHRSAKQRQATSTTPTRRSHHG